MVFFTKGTLSGLDGSVIAASRDVGAGVVYSRVVDGRELTFEANGDLFVDKQTGTIWNILGQAIEGPLAGQPWSRSSTPTTSGSPGPPSSRKPESGGDCLPRC